MSSIPEIVVKHLKKMELMNFRKVLSRQKGVGLYYCNLNNFREIASDLSDGECLSS